MQDVIHWSLVSSGSSLVIKQERVESDSMQMLKQLFISKMNCFRKLYRITSQLSNKADLTVV